ncbi:MAG: hypothetical protein ACKO6N_08900 [Myxococcota bacterium]
MRRDRFLPLGALSLTASVLPALAFAQDTVFNPTWVEWTAFGVINAIIIGIHLTLYLKGNLKSVKNLYKRDGTEEEGQSG